MSKLLVFIEHELSNFPFGRIKGGDTTINSYGNLVQTQRSNMLLNKFSVFGTFELLMKTLKVDLPNEPPKLQVPCRFIV